MKYLPAGMMLVLVFAVALAVVAAPALAQNLVDFPGTVLKVDEVAGKLTVKKDGTRFTFVIDGKTQFSGGPKGLKDVKAGDTVTVSYLVMGSQYVAQKIAKK